MLRGGGTNQKIPGMLIMASGELGSSFVFDLQRFADYDMLAVTISGSNATLTVSNFPSGVQAGDTINLWATAIGDGGVLYGKMVVEDKGRGATLTLENRNPPIDSIKVDVDPVDGNYLNIFNGQYLSSSTSLSIEGMDSVWIFPGTDNLGDWANVERLAEAAAEIRYKSDNGSVISAKNAKMMLCRRISLSDDTYLSGVNGPCNVKADTNGNLTLTGGWCFTNGVVPIDMSQGVDLFLYERPDNLISDWARLMGSEPGCCGVEIEYFKGSYDGSTQTISTTQGAFQILVNRLDSDDPEESAQWHSWYTYVVNEADHSIDVYYEELVNIDDDEVSTKFIAKRQYSDLSNVSFTRLDDPSSIPTLANFGLNGVIDPSATDDGGATDPTKPVITPTTPGRTKILEKYDVKKDIIELSQETGSLDPDKIIVSENGTLTYGTDFANGKANNGAVDLSESEKQGYYMARIADKDGNNKHLVAWSGSEGSTIDLSTETKGAVLKDSGNGKKDTFIGGSGRDDISIGMDDEAIGGKGSDLIKFGRNADGAKLGIGDGDGHDVAKGFSFGFDTDSNVVHILDGQGLGEAGVNSLGRLKVGSARVEFSGTNLAERDQTNLLLEDSRGTHKVAIGKRMDAKSDLADIYYGTASDAEVDFTGFGDGHLLIDLGNSGSYGRSVAEFYGVKQARGAKGADNDIAGADNVNNVLIGGENGRNRLYGGKGGNDRLVGNRTSEDTFYFGADSGNDTIQDYTEEDTVSFLGGSIDHVYVEDDGILKMYWKDEAGNESRLTFNGDMKDYVITYDLGDGKHGAKFGSRLTMTDDTADFVNYYNSGRSSAKGELVVSGYADKAIWLDGSHNVTYEGFQTVDASGLEGDAELAGSSRSDLIIGGSGRNSLWGGAGGNDTLKGGSGWNEFYFGMGEGRDTINGSNADDRVMLYNVSLGDINLKGTGVRNGSMVISLNDGSSLTIEHYGSQGPSTFRLSDGAWSYDKSAGTWKESR